MNDLTPKQHRKALSNFVSLEAKLDTVLFRRRDDDDDGVNPYLAGGAGVAAGAGGALGIGALAKKGQRINLTPDPQPVLPGLENPEIGKGLFTPKPTSTGFLSDLGTGTRATAGEAKEGIMSLWRKLVGGAAKVAK
jgi:hypothetical protein